MAISLAERLNRAADTVKKLTENAEDIKKNKQGRHDMSKFKGSLKEAEAYRKFVANMQGKELEGAPSAMQNLREMITSTDTIQMVPHIIEGAMIEAAEPEYLAANLFNTIQVPQGAGVVVIVPIIGEIFVREVGEAQPYNEDTFDITMAEKSSVNVAIKKVGARVSITDEAMTDYTWDIYNMSVSKLGRAFARFKEEKCFNEFTKHGHVVFDNDPNVVAQDARYRTTGRGKDGAYNGTLSVEDFLDMILASITNNHTPTDCIMHPLTWVIFARNAMIGAGLTWGAFGGQNVHPWGGSQGSGAIGGSTQNNMGNQQFVLSPEQVQYRLPVPLNVSLSPFVRFDKQKKLFDMYVIDRNDVGVIAQKTGITMENWSDPERDIKFIKASERYGVAINGHGRGIMVARHLAVESTYPESIPVHITVDNADQFDQEGR